jgi:Domain of unknown function (DUF4123)
MLIDTFAEDPFEALEARAEALAPSHYLYLLVDGAFVPGLHKMLRRDAKAVLFESLPGCREETQDVSPFLAPFRPADKVMVRLLKRCNGWPMVSAIETTESLHGLSERLAAWCVVEADGQRFNFRFADSRRLPAIFEILSLSQRASFCGPAVRWTYVSRDGSWRELEIDGLGGPISAEPALDQRQFASLVDDSRVDELMVQLRYRGNAIFKQPAKSHSLLALALGVAANAKLADENVLDWCEWFWKRDQLQDAATALSLLETWRGISS